MGDWNPTRITRLRAAPDGFITVQDQLHSIELRYMGTVILLSVWHLVSGNVLKIGAQPSHPMHPSLFSHDLDDVYRTRTPSAAGWLDCSLWRPYSCVQGKDPTPAIQGLRHALRRMFCTLQALSIHHGKTGYACYFSLARKDCCFVSDRPPRTRASRIKKKIYDGETISPQNTCQESL
jgi:hypothetical protein